MTICSKAPESIHLSPSDAAQFHRKYGHEKLELVCVGDPCETYHHADTVTALQAEVDKLREALERLSTAGCMGDGRALGIHLPTHPVGQEIWARMQYAKAALNGDDT